MSRTRRRYETWVKWLDGFDQKLARDKVKRELPQHRRTESNAGWAMEGYRKRKAKRYAKRRRQRDDRIELKKETFYTIEESDSPPNMRNLST